MTVLLPRIDREQAQSLISLFRGLEVVEIAERMPVTDIVTTISDLGGMEIDPARLMQLRNLVVAAAAEYGYPNRAATNADTRAFEARCAQLLHVELNVSPHEAAEDEAWTHLTVCWLMDVAVWRWGSNADERRFRGDINRNAFRRLWWRAEVFGPAFNLADLYEDEFQSLLERPRLAANPGFAEAFATAFLARVATSQVVKRETLMRDACKHLLRLMPIVDFGALSETELSSLTETVLDAAGAGSALSPAIASRPVSAPSDSVEEVSSVTLEMTTSEMASSELPDDISELASVAVGIAQRAGRVTSVTLREAASDNLEISDARRILQALAERGELRRRGRTRGTYYVMPGEDDEPEFGDAAEPADRAPEMTPTDPTPSYVELDVAQDSGELEQVATGSEPPPDAPPPSEPQPRGMLKPAVPQRPAVTAASARQALRRLLGR